MIDNIKKDSLTDRRSKFTRELIRNTFLDMMEQGIRKITVADLCQQANISRGTFYIHYQDIFDVRDDIENEFFKTACDIHEEVKLGKVVNHEKELHYDKARDRRWDLLYYKTSVSHSLSDRVAEYAVNDMLETDLKGLPWPEEEKRVAAICMVAAAMAVDQDAHSHPWKDFEKTNQFYDRLIRYCYKVILQGEFLKNRP